MARTIVSCDVAILKLLKNLAKKHIEKTLLKLYIDLINVKKKSKRVYKHLVKQKKTTLLLNCLNMCLAANINYIAL